LFVFLCAQRETFKINYSWKEKFLSNIYVIPSEGTAEHKGTQEKCRM